MSNRRRLLLSPLWLLVALAAMLGLNATSAAAGSAAETRVRAFEHVTVDAVGQQSSERPASVGCVRPETADLASGSCVATNKVAATGDDLLKPGPWAGDSVPSSAPGKITQAERDLLNPIGDATGCHSCGATTPGTKSGNWIGDHQPVSRTVTPGTSQVLYPHCQACSNDQGLWIINLIRQGKLR